MTTSNIIKAGEQDLGIAIQKLIIQNLNQLNISFLAKVRAIDNNLVDLEVTYYKGKVNLNGVLVGLPFSSNLSINTEIKVGDFGIVFILNNDITNFKANNDNSVETPRKHDLNDSVFLPLSLTKTDLNNNSIICKDNLTLKANTFTIESTNANKSLLDIFSKLLQTLISAQTINAIQGSPLTFSVNTINSLNEINSQLQLFFKGAND